MRFETLIDRHHGEIYAYLWRLLRNAGRTDAVMEAEDLAQEVFVRAYGAFGRLRAGSNHRAWLYKIATNCAATALGRGARDEAPLEAVAAPHDPAPGPEAAAVAEERLRQVARAVAELPPKQRMAVVLRYVQELDYASVAEALDCSQESARANVYQGLKRLREALGEGYCVQWQ